MDLTLHFCQWTRQAALQANKTYREEFSSRLLSTFDNIDEEATKASDEAWRDYMCQPMRSDNDDDPSMYADAARDFGLEVYENLKFTKQQLMGLSISGLYHLWERTLKSFLKKEFKQYGLEEKLFKELARGDFKFLLELLGQFGIDLTAQPHFSKLDELRLLANSVKHGEGSSFDELVEKAPHLFNSFAIEYELELTPDELELTKDHFETYASMLEQFWLAFPQHLTLLK